jgi:hypothetical protein
LLWYKSVGFGCFYITSGSQVVKEKSGIIEGFTFFLDEKSNKKITASRFLSQKSSDKFSVS